MYLITAIVNRECVKDILIDLKDSDIEGVTLVKVKGKGKFIEEEIQDVDEHIKLEIVVSDDRYKELAKEAIRANTGNIEKGSGKMWVTPVLEVERLRTGETDEDALCHSAIAKENHKQSDYYTLEDTPAS